MSEDLLSAWKGHSCTRKLRKHLEAQRKLAMDALMNKARVSADPDVRDAIARHDSISKTLEHVIPTQGDEE